MDFVQLVGIAATVVAVWLAYWSIHTSGKRANEAADALVDERRRNFELDLLKELADQLTGYNTLGNVITQAKVRLSLLQNREEFTMSRDILGLNGEAANVRRTESVERVPGNDILQAKMPGGETVQAHVRKEITDAIERRLAARSRRREG